MNCAVAAVAYDVALLQLLVLLQLMLIGVADACVVVVVDAAEAVVVAAAVVVMAVLLLLTTLLVADAKADTAAILAIDCRFVFSLRQCLSYRIPKSTIKYSISARNTNNMQDISHTYMYAKCIWERQKTISIFVI